MRTKAWTAVVVVSLALGIGANTALFSTVDALLVRKLPVRDPDALVRFRYAGPNEMRTDVLIYGFTAQDARGRAVEPTFSYPMYLQFVAENRTLSDLVACAPIGRVNVVVNGGAQIASGLFATGNYYQALGAAPRRGRTILPEDDRPGAAPVAVISHKYWTTRFGARPDVVGLRALVNNAPVTIVGVLAPDFTGVDQTAADAPDISVPLSLEPQVNLQPSGLQRSLLTASNFWWLHVVGRLKPGATIAQVRANFGGVFQRAARSEFDAFLSALPPDERSKAYLQNHEDVPELLVDSASRGIYDVNSSDLRAITVLSAAVVLVLVLVCANVANLLLSRSTARQKELSVRVALGATRAQLARQLLTESLLLSAGGGVLGLFAGRWGQALVPTSSGQSGPLDWRVAAFVVAVTALTGLLCGIVPAIRATRTDVNDALKENSRMMAASRGALGRSLVVAQVTISLVVLVGSGLFLRTLQNLRHVDLGFNPRNVLLFRISPALNRYDTENQTRLYARIGERIRALAGVRSVAWSNPALMSGRLFSTGMFVQGRVSPGQRDSIFLMIVSPAFFDTMEVPLVAGRGFNDRDDEAAPQVAIINDAAVRRYFPNESPIGRRIGSSVETSGRVEIVGILRDAKYTSVRAAAVPTMYRPYLQAPQGLVTFEVRTAGDPLAITGSVREAVRRIDPNVPLIDVTTQAEEVERRFAQERVFAQAYTLFGGLALVVAGVGLFGLMSYSVARRTYEIGIRMALGAGRPEVVRLVMRESMILVAAGVVLGLGSAAALARFVSAFLFGVAPVDPVAIAGAACAVVFVSAVAGYLPARRASQVDPLIALRSE